MSHPFCFGDANAEQRGDFHACRVDARGRCIECGGKIRMAILRRLAVEAGHVLPETATRRELAAAVLAPQPPP
jgi:hypothetical protein